MKILITSLPDVKRINPQRPHHIIKKLSQNHEVTILSVKAWWLEEKHDEYLEECLKDARLNYITENRINPVLQEILMIKYFDGFNEKLHLNEYDVHINFNSLIAGYYMGKKLQSWDIPTVFDVADDLPERIKTSPQIPFLFKTVAKSFGKVMFKKCIHQGDVITTITNSLMQAYDFPMNKSLLIPNGVDTSIFNNNPENYPDLPELNEYFILGFIGVFSEWVDLEPAFMSLKNLVKNDYKIKMLIVGDGIYLKKFKDLAVKNRISENIIFTGYVPANDLPGYISKMNVCLVYYKTGADCQNSFPLKLLEYMACGKPVISVRLDGVEEVAHDRVFYASDSKEISEKMIELYENSELREKAGIEGMDFVKKNCDWKKVCSDFENVLIEAVNEYAK